MTDQPTHVSRDLPDHHGFSLDNSEDASPTEDSTEHKKSHSMVREIVETLLLALLIFVAVRAVVLNFRVDGHSMDNSLADNEMLLVNRNAYFSLDQDTWFGWIPGVDFDDDDVWHPFGTPERGDIVVLNPPDEANADKPYIKRVVGMPGDTLEVRDDGVFIDGTRIHETYIGERPTRCGTNCDHGGPLVIPEGFVYVMGDNRTNSEDSRFFGLVPVDNIIGKAWITYWPVDEIGMVREFDYPELETRSTDGS